MTTRYLGLDYLRALLIVRLVAFHSVLAYTDFGRPLPAATVPIVDPRQWSGFEPFIALNETFSMSLMFFISGLFVWSGLARKGALAYALARGRRLGIPFALAVIFVMPFAFYPAYRAHGMDLDLLAYVQALVVGRVWAAGPLWFIWLLLVFDLCAAGVYRMAPTALDRLGRIAGAAARRPQRFFFLFAVGAAIAYLPMLIAFGPFTWLTIGPFGVQPSRVLHYAFYFFAGVGVGAYGLERGPLGEASLLVRSWGRWVLSAALLNLFFATALYPIAGALSAASPILGLVVYGLAFVATSAATSFALLAVFQRFLIRHIGVADSLAAHSYGIYIVHYLFVLWVQYLLLGASLPAGIKALTVFAAALALSWSCSALARRRPLFFERGWRGARSVPEIPVRSGTNG
jgi:peptidoglycan/LPS O-acetylase OafA/YrhL